MAKNIIVSIHDIHQGNFQQAQAIISNMPSSRIDKAAIFFVPRYHGHSPLETQPDFISWLRQKHEAGHELFLHGFHHAASESIFKHQGANPFDGHRRSIKGQFVNRFLTSYEGEFCGLDLVESHQILDYAVNDTRVLGFDISGVALPAWYGRVSRVFAAKKGFRFYETRFNIHNLKTGQRCMVLPVSWLGGKGAGRIINTIMWKISHHLPGQYLRLAIHPRDMRSAVLQQRIRHFLETHQTLRYEELFKV